MEAELNDEVQSIIYEDSPLGKGVAERLKAVWAASETVVKTVSAEGSELPENGVCDKIKIVHFKRTDSTNNQAKLYAAKGCGDRTLFVADCQTNGRGRRGRSWLSDSGSGLWMSLLLRPDIEPENASMLTLVAALAVAEALENVVSQTNKKVAEQTSAGNALQTTGSKMQADVECIAEAAADSIADSVGNFKCSIKWPNDIVVNKKKICGILTEMGTDKGNIDYVVIGIGINVNIKQIPDSLSETATSLYYETGAEYERADIIAEFIKAFEKYYKKFLENCSLSGVLEDYNNKLINRKRQVRVLGAGVELVGEALGIDETGALLVRTSNGHIENVVAGEVSVRGLYGYV